MNVWNWCIDAINDAMNNAMIFSLKVFRDWGCSSPLTLDFSYAGNLKKKKKKIRKWVRLHHLLFRRSEKELKKKRKEIYEPVKDVVGELTNKKDKQQFVHQMCALHRGIYVLLSWTNCTSYRCTNKQYQ